MNLTANLREGLPQQDTTTKKLNSDLNTKLQTERSRQSDLNTTLQTERNRQPDLNPALQTERRRQSRLKHNVTYDPNTIERGIITAHRDVKKEMFNIHAPLPQKGDRWRKRQNVLDRVVSLPLHIVEDYGAWGSSKCKVKIVEIY